MLNINRLKKCINMQILNSIKVPKKSLYLKSFQHLINRENLKYFYLLKLFLYIIKINNKNKLYLNLVISCIFFF